MRKVVMMWAIVGAVAGCETNGLIVREYADSEGNGVRVEHYQHAQRFLYSLSARYSTHECKLREVKIVAMGADGKLRVHIRMEPEATCT